MSLLNDMLRDLSHQQKPSELLPSDNKIALELNAQEQRDLFNQSGVVKPLPRSLLPSILVFVVVLVSAVFWQHFWSNKKNTATDTNSDQVIIPSPARADTTSEVSTTVSAETARSTPADLPNPELIARLAALESAVTHLATAVTDHKIADTTLVETSETSIAEPSENTKPQTLAIEHSQTSDAALVGSVSVRDPFAFDDNINHTASPHQNTIVQTLTDEPAHLAIAPNPKWQDAEKAEQARDLVAQGQVDFALEQLQQFIAGAQQPRESVKLMLDIYSDQNDIANMQSLLAQTDFLLPSEQAYYQAKIALIEQNDLQAIQLLETHLNDAENNENYRAFLAGLYQKNGQSLEAANHYRRLLSVFGDKPAYWLGFALAQDALNQSQVALQAYQRVNQYSDLQPQVRTYIQQRLTALQQ